MAQVALSAGDTVYVESRTPGGRRISQHATDAEVFSKIRSRDWDYVVIQCQSQEPSFPDGQVAADVLPFAKILCDSIRANNTCTIPMFYMTWGRKNGDSRNCDFFPPLCTYEGMDSVLRSNYLKMGKLNDAEVAGVGAVWNELRSTTPSLELYNADQSHPSYAGSIAAAYTFYTSVFRKKATDASFNGSISVQLVDSIRAVVDRVIYSSPETYNIGVSDPSSEFSVTKVNCVFSFTANDANFDSYQWTFGDGATATVDAPSHEYTTSGSYTVKLIVTDDCGVVDSTITEVNCGVNSLDLFMDTDFRIYPNPGNGRFTIEGIVELVSAYTVDGREISFTKSGSHYTIASSLNGIVLLTIKKGNTLYYKRVRVE